MLIASTPLERVGLPPARSRRPAHFVVSVRKRTDLPAEGGLASNMANQPASARVLGYFSLGLGAAQIVAPRALAQLIGVKPGEKSEVLMRVVGVREIASGVGILIQHRPDAWLWARVAGDAMDLALLGAALANPHNHRERLAAALAAVGGVTVADVQSAEQVTEERAEERPQRVTRAITINRPPEEVALHLPEGARMAPAPGGRGTEVRLSVADAPITGPRSLWARLFGQTPPQQVTADLRKLKQVLETGEVLVSEATISGSHIFQRAAQPPAPRELAEVRS
jgi:hypothetical protein